MRHAFLILFAASTLGLLAADSFKLPPDTAKLKPGAGAALVTAQCLLCHSADYISTQPRLTRAQWTATVTKMQQKYAAPISTNNVETLVSYLTVNYGREAAPAKEPPRTNPSL